MYDQRIDAMDRTSITLGSDTRDALRDYKAEADHPNYDAAVRTLLEDTPAATR